MALQGGQTKSMVDLVLRRARPIIWSAFSFSLCINVLMLVGPIFMLQVYDRVLTSGSVPTLFFLIIAAVGLLLASGMIDMYRARVLVRLSGQLSLALDRVAFGRVMEFGLLAGQKRLGVQPLRDLETVRTFLSGPSLLTLYDAPWTVIFIFVIFLMDWRLGIIALVGAVILFAIAVANYVITRGDLKEGARAHQRSMTFAEGALRNAEVCAALGMDKGLEKRWAAQHSRSLVFQAEASDRAGALKSLARFVRGSLQIFMLGFGAYLALEQIVSPGIMIAASIILGRALAPVESIIGSWRQVVQAVDSRNRLREFLRDPPRDAPAVPLPRPKGHLTVKGLIAAAPGTRNPIIRGIGFSLSPGEMMGLIGPSASGKTTLARLLVGVWKPLQGEVRLDGANVAEWDKRDLGPYLGYLPQDVELFEGTIADNVARFGEPDADAVMRAADLAGVHRMILSFENAYDTDIGADGMVLSAGQRQRVGLARALYNDPAFVVLDEPNSNLDEEGNRALRRALEILKENGTTVVIIAHQAWVMSHVDKLMVLRQGKVEAFGPREEVMAKLTRSVTTTKPSPQREEAGS